MNIFTKYRCGNRVVEAKATSPSDKLYTLVPTRALIHIPKRYGLKGGDVISKPEGRSWLLAEHHSYGHNDVFVGLAINYSVKVVYSIRLKHPVTGLETNGFSPKAKTYDCVKEVQTPEEVKGLTVSKEVYYFAAPIPKDCKIDGKPVLKVIFSSGIYRVEV